MQNAHQNDEIDKMLALEKAAPQKNTPFGIPKPLKFQEIQPASTPSQVIWQMRRTV